jgi:hypothetical protein
MRRRELQTRPEPVLSALTVVRPLGLKRSWKGVESRARVAFQFGRRRSFCLSGLIPPASVPPGKAAPNDIHWPALVLRARLVPHLLTISLQGSQV